MKQVPKPYLNLLVIIAGITVSVILIAAVLLTRNERDPAETAAPAIKQGYFHYAPWELPCDTTELPDTTVRHEAWHFKNATINTVLDTIWKRYGVCYAFRRPVNNRFTGTIPKDASLNETLRLLVSMTPDSIRIERPLPGQIIVNPKCL